MIRGKQWPFGNALLQKVVPEFFNPQRRTVAAIEARMPEYLALYEKAPAVRLWAINSRAIPQSLLA